MRSIFVSISLLFSFSIQMSGQPILFSDTKTTKSGIRCVAEFQRSVILPVPLKNVHITDSFWLPKLQIYKDQTIPHSWNYLNSVIEEAKGLSENRPNTAMGGQKWHEANLHKHLEAIVFALNQFPDPALKTRLDSIIQLYAKAQRNDGYFYLWGMSRGMNPWTEQLRTLEPFITGHLYEAAASYSRQFDNSFLNIAEKSAQFLCKFTSDDKMVEGCSCPGHGGIELSLVELYRITNNTKYLELAMDLIEKRGKGINGWDCECAENVIINKKAFYPCEYYQDHLPFDKQLKLRGHAVSAIFFLNGIVDIAVETGQKDYVDAALRLWNNVTTRKKHITGGIGSVQADESLGFDYQLPNKSYNESCAACGMVSCAANMLRLEPKAKYADELENSLYNCVLHGISLDGKSFFYQNRLTGNMQRENNWTCCPPNLERTLLGLGRYIYTQTDDQVFVNLYVGNESTISLENTTLDMSISGNYAWDGKVVINPKPAVSCKFILNLRIPGWCKSYSLLINDKKQDDVPVNNGYLVINRTWNTSDKVQLVFEMPVIRVQPNPFVFEEAPWLKAFDEKIALQRGPFIYAVEGIDNNGIVNFTLSKQPVFNVVFHPELLDGISAITANTFEGKLLTAIPYFALANRKQSDTEVWLKQDGKKDNSGGDWEGILYREYIPGKNIDQIKKLPGTSDEKIIGN